MAAVVIRSVRDIFVARSLRKVFNGPPRVRVAYLVARIQGSNEKSSSLFFPRAPKGKKEEISAVAGRLKSGGGPVYNKIYADSRILEFLYRPFFTTNFFPLL